MGIYKRGEIYWYKFMFNGQLIRHSTKQGNNKVAQKQEAMHRARLANGEVGIRERKAAPVLKDFLKTYLYIVPSLEPCYRMSSFFGT